VKEERLPGGFVTSGFLGVDELGREALSFIDGHSARAARSVRDAFDWVSGHRAELAAHVSEDSSQRGQWSQGR
jgi:hypothetical protein